MTLLEVTGMMGNIGEFVGSFAVLATLIYLAVQVREGRTERLQIISDGRAESVRDLYSQVNQQELRSIAAKVNDAFDFPPNAFEKLVMERSGISRQEAVALYLVQVQFLNYTRHQMQLAPQLSKVDRDAFEQGIYYRYSPGSIGGLFYAIQADLMEPDTRTYVDGILTEHERFAAQLESRGM